jgi:hypothetical protein
MELALETAKSETIVHPGNNTALQYDVLAGDGINSGQMTLSREDAATIAAFGGTKVHVINSFANAIGWNTSQEAARPSMAILAYDQAKDTSGNRVWRTHMIPHCIITPNIKGMKKERGDLIYELQPQVSSAYLTGLAFSVANNGFSTAQVITLTSSHRLTVAAWVTTATETEYVFDTDFPKYVTGAPGIEVYKNGIAMTYGATADTTHYVATTTKITFGAALTNGDVVTALYEIDDTAIDIDT